MKHITTLLGLVLVLGCSVEPKNYEDCILQKVTSGMAKEVAWEIVDACRTKFPEEKPEEKQFSAVPKDIFDKLDGRLGVSSGFASGSLYNGNDDWIIREVTIAIESKARNEFVVDGSDEKISVPKESATYRTRVTVQPLSSNDISFKVSWPRDVEHNWYFIEAKGERTRGGS